MSWLRRKHQRIGYTFRYIRNPEDGGPPQAREISFWHTDEAAALALASRRLEEQFPENQHEYILDEIVRWDPKKKAWI